MTERHMGDDVLVLMRNLSGKMCTLLEDRNDSEGLEYWNMRAAAYQREVEQRGLEVMFRSPRMLKGLRAVQARRPTAQQGHVVAAFASPPSFVASLASMSR